MFPTLEEESQKKAPSVAEVKSQILAKISQLYCKKNTKKKNETLYSDLMK